MQNQNGDPVSERLTIEDIYRRYPDEWVVLVDFEADELHNVLGGRILAHSKDRDEVNASMLRARPARFAIEYTGGLPEDMAVIL